FLDGVPGGEEDDRGEERGEEDEPERDAVDAEGVGDAPRPNPRFRLDELHAGHAVLEVREDGERDDEFDERGDQADGFDLGGPFSRQEGEDHRGGNREPEDGGEDVAHASTHMNTTTPAKNISA